MKKAFTIAEVLIAIGIIGVIATITIVNLINKVQDRITYERVNQTYIQISNALKVAQDEYGDLITWGADANLYFTRITESLNLLQDCGASGTASWKRCNPPQYFGGHAGILKTGVIFNIEANDYWWGGYGRLNIDINGLSKPNKKGRDRFGFVFYNRNRKSGATRLVFNGSIPNNQHYGTETCLSNGADWTCTYWLMTYKNRDYARCKEKLSLNGCHSCNCKVTTSSN